MTVTIRTSFLTVLCFAFIGCASTPVRLYSGPPRARNDTARITSYPAFIQSIDGKPCVNPSTFVIVPIEVEPGSHTVTSTYGVFSGRRDPMFPNSSPVTVRFTAVGGREYKVTYPVRNQQVTSSDYFRTTGTGTYDVEIHDTATNELVSRKL